ncbi:serine O-acetyltransferase [Shewanella mangrovisoli]|uniref:serine O-acetyltransferase n=1 Tax=Shewanella mangrovisoli TaxID=2864211 RepID=UPI0035B86C67
MLKKILRWILIGDSIETLYYRALRLKNKGGLCNFISLVCIKKINRKYSCYLSDKATIGQNIKFPHPVGIVIGDGVSISDNVTIYQNVTLGAARVGEGVKGLYPKVGKDVVIFAGAKVIGNITIGDGAVIGANSVVTKDIPVNVSAVGIPAKVVGDISTKI